MPAQQLNLFDATYPQLLKTIPQPPSQLFFTTACHDISFLHKSLAMVGSRTCTAYGIHMTETLVRGLVDTDVCLTSGFMYGIDYYVHYYATKYKIKTCAVLATGLGRQFNTLLTDLHAPIMSNGAFISEYLDDQPVKKWHFPRRNRIVAGMSCGVVVIEAAENSGSLITAGLARKFGRPVFVVPGNMTSTNSMGILSLLKTGAIPVARGDDILVHLAPIISSNSSHVSLKHHANSLTLSGDEKKVFDLLCVEALSQDDLTTMTAFGRGQLMIALTGLCLKNLVFERGSYYYVY